MPLIGEEVSVFRNSNDEYPDQSDATVGKGSTFFLSCQRNREKICPQSKFDSLAAGFVGLMAVVFVLSNVSADFVREYINSLIF